ncbi:MAG: hypothetical protein H5U40_07395 [Polyangiaceae bacterium]|nr:hypothetical protein [Polyangiaceae bacterium]
MKRTTDANNAQTAMMASIAAGVWLFISAFAWAHSASQRTNTVLVGLVIAAASAAALRNPQARFVNTVAAAWLFISAFALPTLSQATQWNNAIVALLVLGASFVGVKTKGGQLPRVRV